MVRNSDKEEMLAHFVAVLCNFSGHAKTQVTAEAVLGRPLRANWNSALAAKDRRRMEELREQGLA